MNWLKSFYSDFGNNRVLGNLLESVVLTVLDNHP